MAWPTSGWLRKEELSSNLLKAPCHVHENPADSWKRLALSRLVRLRGFAPAAVEALASMPLLNLQLSANVFANGSHTLPSRPGSDRMWGNMAMRGHRSLSHPSQTYPSAGTKHCHGPNSLKHVGRFAAARSCGLPLLLTQIACLCWHASRAIWLHPMLSSEN